MYLSPPVATQADIAAVVKALKSGWLAPVGPELTAFENEAAAVSGVAFAVGLSSGTAALHLGLKYVGVEPGDYVLVPTVTFGATAFAVKYLGAEPVFIDIDESWNMDPSMVVEAISSLKAAGRKISGAVPVDLYGCLANYSQLEPILNHAGIPLIEDAAEAVGSFSTVGRSGSFGRGGVLSFNGNKIITSSGGGMLVTDDEAMATTVRFWATQSREDEPWYEHREIGYNYRLSNILASLGRSQILRLDAEVAKRRQIREWYRTTLSAVPGVSLQSDPPGITSNAWLTVATFNHRLYPEAPTRIRMHLERENIESRPVWKPLHLQPVFAGSKSFLSGAAECLFREGLCLPSGSNMSEEDVQRVCGFVIEELLG